MTNISYIVYSGQIADTGDYESTLNLYHRDTIIGFAGEQQDLTLVRLDEKYDAELTIDIISLTLEDLRNIYEIMLWWTRECIDEPVKLKRKE